MTAWFPCPVSALLMAPDCWKKCQSALGRIKDLIKPRIALKWTDLHWELALKTKNNIFGVRRKEIYTDFFIIWWKRHNYFFLNRCCWFTVAFLCALNFPNSSFKRPHDEPTHLLCLLFSLPPQQMAVVIFKCRKYFVNYSWVNTLQNCFKALQFFHAHYVPTESSHLDNQIILKNLMRKVILNTHLFLTSCSNDSCVQKNSFTKHLYQHPAPQKPPWQLLKGLFITAADLFMLGKIGIRNRH